MKFPWSKEEKPFFSPEEQEQLLRAIQAAEQNTSGEIRMYIEPRCRFMDALDRAREIFFQLKMNETAERNATLIYLAHKDHQFAIYGDEGIYQKVGQAYWDEEVRKVRPHFQHEHLVDGLCLAITDLGEALKNHFPYNRDTDKNELPDEIVFGS